MITVKLKVREERITDNGYPVILYMNINGNRLRFYIDIYIKEPSYLRGNRISKKDPLYKEKNIKIMKVLSEANIIVLRESNIQKIKEEIADILNHRVTNDKRFVDYIKDFMSTKSHVRTLQLYQGTINKINAFDTHVHLEDVDSGWLVRFEEFCAKTMSVNGYGIHFRNIKAVFNFLRAENIIDYYPFKTYKIKYEKTEHRNLSIEELRQIRDVNTPVSSLKYRDMFMLMIYLHSIIYY